MNKLSKITLYDIIIILLLFFISIKILSVVVGASTKSDSQIEKVISEKNLCLGINYHRIRKPNIWNKFVESITNSQELMIYSVYSDEFENQIIKLKEIGAYFATLEEVITFKENNSFPDKCVWISFDDVDKSVYEIAYPILKKYNIPFTLFVISGQVGNKNFSNLELATWDDLREMRDSGLASFGSHTYDMHYLEDNSAKFLKNENYIDFFEDLKLSKQIMENELGISIEVLAYPFGTANEEIMKIAKDSGFTSAYLLNNSYITGDSEQFGQGRYLLDRSTFDNIIFPTLKNN